LKNVDCKKYRVLLSEVMDIALCYSYHQKVPPVAPDLELKATFGLAAPEEFKLPEPSAQWTAAVYKAFDITKMPTRNEVYYTAANLLS